ncbi:chemotaxis protein CheW [Eubacteriaceae bacterium ES2]|nr:chemotaxis protein CheW [Eubacteriaceae bacterium ES2]
MNEEEQVEYFEEDTKKGRYLTFYIGIECYGIWIEYITEIIGIVEYTEVPDVPNYVKGIINLRGRIIPIIDMRLRFHKEFVDYNEQTCIVIIDYLEDNVGLIVDKVSEVVEILDEDILAQPVLETGSSNQFIKSIGKVGEEVKLLLDCQKLLSENEF